MLSACASSRPATGKIPAAEPPATVVVTKVERQLVCPAELDQDPGRPPAVPAGATVEVNAPGETWLKALTDWGWSLRDRLLDAKSACQAQVEADQVKPAPR